MLKLLQNSVEEGELVWRSKMANTEEQLREVSDDPFLKWLICSWLEKLTIVSLTHYQALEKISGLDAEYQSVEQVRIFFFQHFKMSSWCKLTGEICVLLCVKRNFGSLMQLKEQMMLLEAQLEKQSENQTTSEETEPVMRSLDLQLHH